jgi:hypothetical protein
MRRFFLYAAVAALCSIPLAAQQGRQGAPGPGGRGGPPGPAPSGRAAAPFDLTGVWVALVTDDWRYRMLTPPKGNADYLPVNNEARRVMGEWDPAKDEAAGEACRAYGAGGVMRLPGRLRISWENDNLLKMELDAGTQTRRFQFGAAPAPTGEPTWQGVSTARWQFSGGRARGPVTAGQLVVTTNRLKPGYLRKNGVPYSSNAVITEYYVRLVDEGQEYLAVTTMVDDPQYLALPYIKTYQYKKERDASGWNPSPCIAR